MKLYLEVKYNVARKEKRDSEDLVKDLGQKFEENPGEFLNFILGIEDAQLDYEFREDKSNPGTTNDDFDCNLYYYHKERANNLCLKFGALCSNFLCEHYK